MNTDFISQDKVETSFYRPDTYKAPDNAHSIKLNELIGINRVVDIVVYADGEKIKGGYKAFHLSQSASTHHAFELTLANDAFSNRQDHHLNDVYRLIGKRLSAIIRYKDLVKDGPKRVFVGVITQVGFSQEHHSAGNIVLKGYSPTILLDGAPHTQSFGGDKEVNTGIIAEEVIQQGIDKRLYDYRIEVKGQSAIEYSSQYNETHYNYLCRLAHAHGEQFYYDGEFLHFGRMPAPNTPISLTYGGNVRDVRVELKAVHTTPSFYGYNPSQNADFTSGSTPLKHRSDIAKKAYEANEGIFKVEAKQHAPIRTRTDLDVTYAQESEWAKRGTEVFSISGTTTVPFLYPGCVAEIRMRKTDTNQTRYFTKIIITEIDHKIDGKGHYEAHFKAVAADTGFMPTPEFVTPKADPELAEVISNEDPLNQGRVKVRFKWQQHHTTDWVRVMSPDAGGTNAVSQNRGYVAVPEVGDQVMIGYRQNHPDMPFVMGGMFHGNTALGGGINNHLRSIQTKSGIKVLMNDDDQSVTILDPSGNTWFMDGQGNIEVTTPKDLTFNVGQNLNVNVTENIYMTSGENTQVSVGKDMKTSVTENNDVFIGNNHKFTSSNYNQIIKEDKTVMIAGDLNETTASTTHRAQQGDLLIQSAGISKILGAIDAKVNKG